ncbi:TIGR03087 family PEP-CTERM/XrtA system glycosyltransferase [Parvularcula marina]|uniref:TIGR03087 family PEP-CTERM/XrtA system glycosyltransferase n=1 Tax=Parvularcula marina TaxID=2292771 RepID=UPI0035183FED
MTGAKKRALLLTHRIPYPPNKGDKIRSWHLTKFLADRYDLALGTFIDDPSDAIHTDVLENLCAATCIRPLGAMQGRWRSLKGLMKGQPLSFAWYEDELMRSFVARERAKGLVAEIYFSGAMTIYADGAKAPLFVDMVDADSAKWQSYAADGLPFMRALHRREARKVAVAETRAAELSEKTFLVSPEEADLLKETAGMPQERVDWYRNGIDLSFWNPDGEFPHLTHPFDIVFTGAMDYRPNADAVIWFVREVWPQLKHQHPTLTFGIIGRDPTGPVRKLGMEHGVTVTGRVDDIRPFIADAQLAVAPLRIARGVQNKVLEAMAMGVPVIASSGALTGISVRPGEHLLEANSAEETAAKVLELLGDPELRRRLGEAGRSLMQDEYKWEAVLGRIAAHLPPGK